MFSRARFAIPFIWDTTQGHELRMLSTIAMLSFIVVIDKRDGPLGLHGTLWKETAVNETTASGRTSSARPTAGRLGGRALLVIVAAVTTLATLGLVLNDIVRVAYTYMGGYGIEVALLSYEGVPADIPGANANNTAEYWRVIINTYENVDASRHLQTLAIALTTLTFVAGAIVIIMLCRRLWTGRTFATTTAAGVLIVAVLTMVTAWVAPWLRHTADTLALAATPFPTTDGGVFPTEESPGSRWVELPHFDTGSADGAVLLLGVILALLALVYLGARRLQRDTEGLV